MKFEVYCQVTESGIVKVFHAWNDDVHTATDVINVYEQTKELAIQQALIALGWTPPKEN